MNKRGQGLFDEPIAALIILGIATALLIYVITKIILK